ncbi:MAG: type II and III secretion system protein [Planctomycetes bacterium]|nr:type II and III secretion system protein [Planctomycetota bacterium]
MLGNRQVYPILVLAFASCVSSSPRRIDPSLQVQYEVEGRSALGGNTAGPLVWGLGDRPSSRDAEARQDPQNESQDDREARLRTQFGSSILIGADGSVTKQYFLAGDLSTTFLKLIAEIEPGKPVAAAEPAPPPAGTKVGGGDSRSVLGRMLGENVIEVTYVPDFEVLSGSKIVDIKDVPSVTGEPIAPGKALPKVGLALITAQPSALRAFESALNMFYANIPQVEISVQVVEFSNANALAFGISTVDNNTPILSNLSSGQLVRAFTSVFPMRQPVVGSSPVTDVGRFTLGGIHESWELNMMLEALEANNLADIQSSPKLVVRNGGVAAISTLAEIPFPKAKIQQLGTEVATDIAFKQVGVKMNIIPMIAGTDSVILQIYSDVSAITGFAGTEPIVTPITSTRTAVTTVYLKDKHTLVIGGLKSKTKYESETKVPLLGDIPLLGFLFRSTSIQESETTVEFHITPRIVTDRGIPAGGPVW